MSRTLAQLWRRAETDGVERDSAAMEGRRRRAQDDAAAAEAARATIAATDPGYAEAVCRRQAETTD
jgi:hypothetical protein